MLKLIRRAYDNIQESKGRSCERLFLLAASAAENFISANIDANKKAVKKFYKKYCAEKSLKMLLAK